MRYAEMVPLDTRMANVICSYVLIFANFFGQPIWQ